MNTIKLIETELMKVLEREKDSGLGHRSASVRIASPTRAVREIGCSNVSLKEHSPVLTRLPAALISACSSFCTSADVSLWVLDGNSQLVDPAGEVERHLVVFVVYRRAGCPRQCQRTHQW